MEGDLSMTKGELATFKGQKVHFKIVTNFPDLKVQFVDHFGDFKVKVLIRKVLQNKLLRLR